MGPLISFLVGFATIMLMGATTDQIWQSVYDSGNTALRVNQVAGGGAASSMTVGSTTISGGSTGQLLYDNAGTLGERANPLIVGAGGTGAATFTANGVLYGNTTSAIGVTAAGTTGQVLTSNGSGSAPTYQTPGQSTSAPLAILLPNASVTGTTVNKLSKVKTDGTVVITATTDTVGALGIVVSGAGTTGSAVTQLIGSASCVFDNTTTQGDFFGISSSVAGDCTDLGSTFPSDKSVLGIVTEAGAAGTRAVILQTPDIMNTTNIKGGNPGKGNINNLIYTGTLSVQDIHADSSNFTVAHRIAYVTTSTSTITATTPASPTVGDTYTVVKADSGSGKIQWTRAGSQTLNGATTRDVTVQYGVDTCVYMASNAWICQGSGG